MGLKGLLQKATSKDDHCTYGFSAQANKKPEKKGSAVRVLAKSKRSSTRVLMKRRARLEDYRRRSSSGMESRVRTLKSLIPESAYIGLEGLFRETADYILSLEMRVRVMQIMVDALTASDNDDQ